MPGVFQMQTETMSTTSAFLADQADDLERELADINRRWRDLAAMWTGRAASAYEPAWEEWHDGAKTVVAILQEHSDLLQRAVAMAVADEQQRAVCRGLYRPGDTCDESVHRRAWRVGTFRRSA